jgi:hypothetical protein
MDYIFLESLHQTELVSIVVSYDIVCQWSINLWHRMKMYSPRLQLAVGGKLAVVFLVPKFHLAAHIASCQIKFSFNLTRWSGRTDGEAPERGWSRFNNISVQTIEMGPGSRRDTLDDHFGDWNWKKTIGLGKVFHSICLTSTNPFAGKLLLRRISTAVSEAAEMTWAFDQFSSPLESKEIECWKAAVESWERGENVSNPYEIRSTGMSYALSSQILMDNLSF